MTEVVAVECTHVRGQARAPTRCSAQRDLAAARRAEGDFERHLSVAEALLTKHTGWGKPGGRRRRICS